MLGVLRLAAAAILPAALLHASRWPSLPVLLFVLAAATDYLDGPIARRGSGPTRHGAVLDNAADIAFVLAGTLTAAALGVVPRAVPLAIGVAFGGYVAASVRGAALARSRVGHAAGVLNYALVGLVAGAAALPGAVWRPVLSLASLVVIGVNGAAVVERLLTAALLRARAPRDAGTPARSARSSA